MGKVGSILAKIISAVIGLIWQKKEKTAAETELAKKQRENLELKGELAGKEVEREIEKEKQDYDEATKQAEATPDKKDDYDVLHRDFRSDK